MNLASRHPIVLVIPVGLVILGAFVHAGKRRGTCFHESRTELARVIAKEYAYEAYPQWAVDHPARACPTSLAELDGYLHRAHSLDPWGRRYLMTCDRHGMTVRSSGPDRRWYTADDLSSNE
jgi:hypothetical protein